MLRTRAWLLAMIPLSVALLVRCSGDNEEPAPAAPLDSGVSTATAGQGICPDAAPEGGQGCVLPEGTTCAFGGCGAAIARCQQGTWRYGGNIDTPACPADFPASEQPCPVCFPADLRCTYGSTDCSAPDASTNRSVASCPQGKWVIETFPCSDASLSTPEDAGADVQGDAGLDSD